MSFEFSNEVVYMSGDREITIIDLCAGIGMLSYPIITKLKNLGVKFRYVCIEYNHSYYEVGKKLLPEAEWYCMDVCDVDEIKKLGHFDIAISKPTIWECWNVSAKRKHLDIKGPMLSIR